MSSPSAFIVAVSSTSIEHSSSHNFELDQMAKGSKKECPFLENKIIFIFKNNNTCDLDTIRTPHSC
jgi:hypothetical protein